MVVIPLFRLVFSFHCETCRRYYHSMYHSKHGQQEHTYQPVVTKTRKKRKKRVVMHDMVSFCWFVCVCAWPY